MELKWRRLEGRGGHAVGRELLAELAGDRELRYTDRGKPYFPEGPHFSIAHTDCHVFCCISGKNVGMDAEEVGRKVDPRLAERFLSPAEAARAADWLDPNDALLRLWVLKEAYAKLTGRGIGNYMKNTDFSPNDCRIVEIDGCYVAILEE